MVTTEIPPRGGDCETLDDLASNFSPRIGSRVGDCGYLVRPRCLSYDRSRAGRFATGDFDSDGDLDIAVSVDVPNRVEVYPNDGFGTFGIPAQYLTGSGTGAGALVAGDWDGDGDLDLMVALANNDQVQVLWNVFNGFFGLGPIFDVGVKPSAFAAAYLNGDTLIDVACTNEDSDNVSILTNTGGTIDVTSVVVGEGPRSIAAAQLAGSSAIDLVVGNHRVRTMSLLTNLGGSFGRLDMSSGARPSGVAIGDLDRDGDLDFVAATSDTGVNYASIFVKTPGGFTGPISLSLGGADSEGIALIDCDSDGDLDIATANSTSNNVSVLENLGNLVFGPPSLFAALTRPGYLIAADWNHDGRMDLATPCRDSDGVAFFYNNAPQQGMVTGVIDLKDFGGNLAIQPIFFEVISGGVTVDQQVAMPRIDGYFSFRTARRGTFDIGAKGSHWLRQVDTGVLISNSGASGLVFSLFNGDADGDNEIAIGDYSMLSAAFNAAPGSPNWNPNTDFNGDETVDIGDFAILSSNFGMVGD